MSPLALAAITATMAVASSLRAERRLAKGSMLGHRLASAAALVFDAAALVWLATLVTP